MLVIVSNEHTSRSFNLHDAADPNMCKYYEPIAALHLLRLMPEELMASKPLKSLYSMAWKWCKAQYSMAWNLFHCVQWLESGAKLGIQWLETCSNLGIHRFVMYNDWFDIFLIYYSLDTVNENRSSHCIALHFNFFIQSIQKLNILLRFIGLVWLWFSQWLMRYIFPALYVTHVVLSV